MVVRGINASVSTAVSPFNNKKSSVGTTNTNSIKLTVTNVLN